MQEYRLRGSRIALLGVLCLSMVLADLAKVPPPLVEAQSGLSDEPGFRRCLLRLCNEAGTRRRLDVLRHKILENDFLFRSELHTPELPVWRDPRQHDAMWQCLLCQGRQSRDTAVPG